MHENTKESSSEPFYKPPNQRYEFLDGLRGIAALLVVIFHFNNLLKKHAITPFPKLIEWIFDQGHCGVEIFFILSGFVIAYSIRYQYISFDFVLNFFVKRSIRLDPPYWMTLSLLIVLSLIGNIFKTVPHALPSFREIGINFFYLAEICEVSRILPVSWTLSLEIQFYIFLILMVKGIQFLNSRFSKDSANFSFSLPALVVVSLSMILSILENTPYAPFSLVPGLFITKWYSFLIGSLICWRMLNLISPIFFWINFGFIVCYGIIQNSVALETCVISSIIYFVGTKGGMHSLLTSSIFQYLGKISYSLYLLHWVIGVKIIDFAIRFLGAYLENFGIVFLILMFALISTIFVTDIFYRIIELPSLRLSRKFKANSRQTIFA